MAMDEAVTFSPWASIDSASADQWKSVNAQYNPGAQPDDVGLVVFGLGVILQEALQKAGPNLSAASLVAALNGFQSGVAFWAPFSFSASNHFGPAAVDVFKGNGQSQRFVQITGFTSGF
jgi:hypothetical protein